MTNADFVKGSKYFLDEMFDLFKDQFLTIQEWAEILTSRDGILNFTSLYKIIKKNISYYYSSIKVKSFIYKDKKYWINKDTRISLYRLIESGASTITLQLNDIYVEVSAEKLKKFLDELEIYAGKCFSTTAKHLQKLDQLQTTEQLKEFDYTAGYPDILTLNVD